MTPDTPQGEPAAPAHIGIIMDGNGRWAQSRGLPRTQGHREGLETAKKIVARASDLGVRTLSLYAFSTENWKRTEEEVSYLMGLIRTHLRKQYDFYKERGIRVVHSGDLERLPDTVQKEILLAEQDTREFDGLTVNLLINYGGRDEIIRALRKLGSAAAGATEEDIASSLDHPETGDLDLLIRTGGELRISNFMMWQSAYAELYFSDDYWPDWTEAHLDAAVLEYNRRQRRFGGVIQ